MTGKSAPAPGLGELTPDLSLLPKIPIGYARKHLLLPCRNPDGEAVLLSGKPEKREAIDEMRFLAGLSRVVAASPEDVLARIDAAYERSQTPEREIVEGLSGEWDLDVAATIEETRTSSTRPTRPPSSGSSTPSSSAPSATGPATSISSRTRRSWPSGTGWTGSCTTW